MSEDDKELFAEGRPYMIAVIAVLFAVGKLAFTPEENFKEAERYVVEFERRNGIAK